MVVFSTHGLTTRRFSPTRIDHPNALSPVFVEVGWWWTNSLSTRFSINEAQKMLDKPYSDGMSTKFSDSFIEKRVDNLFGAHHPTSTKTGDKALRWSIRGVKMSGGQTKGGENNHV